MPSDTRIRGLQPRPALLLALAISLSFCELLPAARAQCGPLSADQARQYKLAMYKVTLRTYWSRARFPRHYPEWRPPAQFGKLVGRTHDASYVLYRLGQRLSSGARQYVETGRTDGLDTGAEFPNTLHSFTGPAVPQGEGISTARAFLDANHTLVSVFARINPSPDWFVGLDSFQLCVEGNWVDTVTVELDPLDGGTDNGFTFTAANWPTQPQGIAYRITSRYPAHPAGSFYYPNLARLPPIATLTFTKLREYSLTETYHEDDVEMEFVSSDNQLSRGYGMAVAAPPPPPPPTPRAIDPNQDLNEAIAEERREMDTQRYRYWTPNNSREQQTVMATRDNKAAIMDSIASSYGVQQQQQQQQQQQRKPTTLKSTMAATSMTTTTTTATTTTTTARPTMRVHLAYPFPDSAKQSWQYYQASRASAEAQKAQIYQDIQRKIVKGSAPASSSLLLLPPASWANVTGNSLEHQRRYRAKHHRLYSKAKRLRTRPPRDCKLGDWGAWSACSRSCGVGETQRTRRVLIKPRRGGQPCAPLKETKWCGSISPCPTDAAQRPADYYQQW